MHPGTITEFDVLFHVMMPVVMWVIVVIAACIMTKQIRAIITLVNGNFSKQRERNESLERELQRSIEATRKAEATLAAIVREQEQRHTQPPS